MINISHLNQNQQEVVLWNKSPLLVLGGPGSGKTEVLAYRIARILDESPGKHFRILVLTFTNKTAIEICTRLRNIAQGSLERVKITAFHSFAAELLYKHGNHNNIKPDFNVFSNNIDRELLLNDAIIKLRKDLTNQIPNYFDSSQLLPIVTWLLGQCVPTEESQILLKLQNFDNQNLLVRVYIAYHEALRTINSLDFPSLIAELIELLTKFPFLLSHIKKVYTHILVDEFQYINHSQYHILSLIAKLDPSTLFVVADDDQINYQRNRASEKRINDLRKDFNVSVLQLPDSYRCPQSVIHLTNILIANNISHSPGKEPLIAFKQDKNDNSVKLIKFNTLNEEIKWIVHDIKEKSLDIRTNCAVLARTKKLIELIAKEMELNNVSIFLSNRNNQFNSAPFRMLHAIFRLINSKEEIKSLFILSRSFYEIISIDIDSEVVIYKALANNTDLLRSWLDEVICRNDIDETTKKLLTLDIKPLLDSLNYKIFSDKLINWASEKQYLTNHTESTFCEFNDEIMTWNIILRDIDAKFEGNTVNLNQFLHELDLTSKSPPKQHDAIPCLTIHASKGLEFDHVYLMGLVEDQSPSWAAAKKGHDSKEMREERRSLFAAITSARESLTLTYSEEVFGWPKKPSRFLFEMGLSRSLTIDERRAPLADASPDAPA